VSEPRPPVEPTLEQLGRLIERAVRVGEAVVRQIEEAAERTPPPAPPPSGESAGSAPTGSPERRP